MSRFAGRFLVSTVIDLHMAKIHFRMQIVVGFAARVESVSDRLHLSWLTNNRNTGAG